jgi:hypothetical protein
MAVLSAGLLRRLWARLTIPISLSALLPRLLVLASL